jgi:hypothetical protein
MKSISLILSKIILVAAIAGSISFLIGSYYGFGYGTQEDPILVQKNNECVKNANLRKESVETCKRSTVSRVSRIRGGGTNFGK